jgi:hypothetical protein
MTENQPPKGSTPPVGDRTGPDEASASQDPNPLASGQLVESPQSDTRMADDPLGEKQPADDPLGSDPLTLDRRNPPRTPGV